MIRLFINDTEELDLPQNQTINTVYECDFFEFDNIIGSYTIPMSLPLSEKNMKALKFISSNDIVINTVEFPCSIYVNNILKDVGTIIANKADNTINTTILIDNGNFYYRTKNLMLRDTDLGGTLPFVFNDNGYDPETDHFQLPPVFCINFFEGTNFQSENAITMNSYIAGAGYVEFSEYYKTNAFVVSPMPYLWYVIQQVFETNGITVKSNIFKTHDDLSKLIMFNNYNAVEYDIVTNNEYEQKIDTYNLANHLPDISIHEFLAEIKKFSNCIYDIKSNTVEILLAETSIFQNTKIIDITTKVHTDYNEKEFIELFDNIEIGSELDGDNAQTIKNIVHTQRIVDTAGGILSLDDPNAFLNSVPSTLTYLFRTFEKFYQNNLKLENNILTVEHPLYATVYEQPYWSKVDELCRIKTQDGHILFTNFGQSLNTWTPKAVFKTLQIRTKVCTIYNIYSGSNIPECDLKGRNWFNREENVQKTIKLLIYHGMTHVDNIPENPTYPFASADFYDPTKTDFTNFGNLRLRYVPDWAAVVSDETGFGVPPRMEDCLITKVCFKAYLKWKLAQKTIDYRKVDFTIFDVKNFDFKAKYKIKNQLYYCTQIKTTNKMNGSQETVLRLVKT